MRPVLFAHLRVLLVCYLTRTVCQSVSHSLLVSEFARGRLVEDVFQIPAGYDGAAVEPLPGSPQEITLVCIGPLHNLAAALDSHPDLPQLLRDSAIKCLLPAPFFSFTW